MTDEILAKQDGPILRITINQPARGNTVSNEMVAEMTRLVAGAEPAADLIVIRGAGKDFCLGRFRGAAPPAPPEALELRDSSDTIFDFYRTLRGAKVPVVCAVQGAAIGFGCALAAGCDITLAAAAAVFQTPEMEHNILPTVVLSTFVDRLPRKALAYLVYILGGDRRRTCLELRPGERHRAGRRARRGAGTALRRDPQGAAGRDPRRQGIPAHRAGHADRRRRRLCPQPARGNQFLGPDACKAALSVATAAWVDKGGGNRKSPGQRRNW